jgi:energy-coupling factor transporter ATP-binding protein EcfA2
MAAVIELTALTKRYGATVGIDKLDLQIEAGEVFGFLGPNGAGKTTTIRCMVGLLSPTAGTVRVLGLDPIADHERLTPHIGYLPGELRLYGELTGALHLAILGELQGRPTPRRGELCERLELAGRDLGRLVRHYSHVRTYLDLAYASDPSYVGTWLVRDVDAKRVTADLDKVYVTAGLRPVQHVGSSARTVQSMAKSVASHGVALRQVLPLLLGPHGDSLLRGIPLPPARDRQR